MFERFTERARQVVVLAQEEARELRHNYIGTEHILLGLLREEEGIAAQVLGALDITVQRVRAQVLRIVGSGEEVSSGQMIPFTPQAKKVLELALRQSLSLGHNYIGTEHILLALAQEGEGVAARILRDFDADAEVVQNAVIWMLSGPRGGQREEGPTAQAPGLPMEWAWLGPLHPLLNALGRGIRAQLGREPDEGDLLVALACAPGTVARRALNELGVKPESVQQAVERARQESGPITSSGLLMSEIRRHLGLTEPPDPPEPA